MFLSFPDLPRNCPGTFLLHCSLVSLTSRPHHHIRMRVAAAWHMLLGLVSRGTGPHTCPDLPSHYAHHSSEDTVSFSSLAGSSWATNSESIHCFQYFCMSTSMCPWSLSWCLVASSVWVSEFHRVPPCLMEMNRSKADACPTPGAIPTWSLWCPMEWHSAQPGRPWVVALIAEVIRPAPAEPGRVLMGKG